MSIQNGDSRNIDKLKPYKVTIEIKLTDSACEGNDCFYHKSSAASSFTFDLKILPNRELTVRESIYKEQKKFEFNNAPYLVGFNDSETVYFDEQRILLIRAEDLEDQTFEVSVDLKEAFTFS
jgi:hypothetical protein